MNSEVLSCGEQACDACAGLQLVDGGYCVPGVENALRGVLCVVSVLGVLGAGVVRVLDVGAVGAVPACVRDVQHDGDVLPSVPALPCVSWQPFSL
jgi:hypothetical protein